MAFSIPKKRLRVVRTDKFVQMQKTLASRGDGDRVQSNSGPVDVATDCSDEESIKINIGFVLIYAMPAIAGF